MRYALAMKKLLNRWRYRRLRRLANLLYPDSATRTNMFLAEGAELATIECWNNGGNLKYITIVPDPADGFYITIEDSAKPTEAKP